MSAQSRSRPYLLATAALAAATALRWAIDPWLGGLLPVVTYYLAVIAAAVALGTLPALATMIAGGALAWLLFAPASGPDLAIDLGRYFVVCSVLIAVLAAIQRSHRRAERQAAIMADTVRTALDCIVTIDAEDRVIEFNPAAERTFGYRRDEALGRPLAELIIPPELRARHRAALQRYLGTGEKTILDRRIEVEALHADGSRILVELSVTRVSAADPPIFTAYLRDITERRRTERSLHESEQRFRQLIDQVRDYAIFLIDTEGRAASWNQGVKRILGFDEGEFIGLDVRLIFTPEDVARGVPQMELDVARDEGRAGDDRWMRRKDGSRFFAIGVTIARRDDAGRIVGYAKIMRDQTERKRLEEDLRRTAANLEQMNERQSRFLAMLSHELRNPLAPIRNAVEILRRGHDPARTAAATAMIGRQVGQLVRLIDDLLDVNRIREGKIRLRTEVIDLVPVIAQAMEIAQAQCAGGGQQLRASVPSEPLRVEADATRIVQVVSNLLHNACKFTPRDGGIQLSAAREGDEAVIRVRDTGMGIPQGELERIFGMFEQLEAAPGQAQAGLGIGLSLSKSLVEMHGGRLEAHSEGPGKGSEFVVRLPLAEHGAATAPKEPVAQRAAARRRVLVVDDNVDAADSLATVIRLNGHEVHSAHDGEEALAQAELHRPELVLLDIGLPKLDGYEVARRLRARADGPGVTLVAVTGWGMEEDVRRAREAGFDAHVTKPIEYDALLEILARPTMRG